MIAICHFKILSKSICMPIIIRLLAAESIFLMKYSGYVFYNKNKDKLKMIYYDGTGFMLCYKRLEEGKLIISLNSETTQYHIDKAQFYWLLSGLDFMRLKKLPKEYQDYA
jgi:hypothetical protein